MPQLPYRQQRLRQIVQGAMFGKETNAMNLNRVPFVTYRYNVPKNTRFAQIMFA